MIRIVPVYPITQEMYINYFGGKTSLNKADRAYIHNKSKTDLFNEASSLGLMVDEKLTKQQIYNLIKRLKEEQAQDFNMQDLLESLPTNDNKQQKQVQKTIVKRQKTKRPEHDSTQPRKETSIWSDTKRNQQRQQFDPTQMRNPSNDQEYPKTGGVPAGSKVTRA